MFERIKKDYVVGPRDLSSTTWYLNKARLRTCDYFPMVVKIDKKELKVKKKKKDGAGWIPKTENESQQFQDLVLCPAGSRGWMNDDGEGSSGVLR